MPTYKKLEIGEEVTFICQSVAVDKAGKWPDYAFTAQDGTIYTAPKQAIDRQLERLTLSILELPNTCLWLQRAPNKDDAKKSWWNLDLGSPQNVSQPPSKRLTHQEATSHTQVPGTPPKAAQEAAMREANRHSPKALPGHDPEAPPFVPVEYDDKAGAETYAPYIESQPMGGSKRVRDWEAIERAYQWALATAYAAQTNVLGTEMGEGLTPTMESVQAGAATLLIAADKMGAIR